MPVAHTEYLSGTLGSMYVMLCVCVCVCMCVCVCVWYVLERESERVCLCVWERGKRKGGASLCMYTWYDRLYLIIYTMWYAGAARRIPWGWNVATRPANVDRTPTEHLFKKAHGWAKCGWRVNVVNDVEQTILLNFKAVVASSSSRKATKANLPSPWSCTFVTGGPEWQSCCYFCIKWCVCKQKKNAENKKSDNSQVEVNPKLAIH
jgi:hypothetical protein